MVSRVDLRTGLGRGLVGVLAFASGCVPGPTGTTTPADPPAGQTSVSSAAPSVSPTVERKQDDTPLPDAGYPAEVRGYRLNIAGGFPNYDVGKPTDSGFKRVAVGDLLRWEVPLKDQMAASGRDVTEVLPGIYCFVDAQKHNSCETESPAFRHFLATDMYSSMSLQELAEWMREFVSLVRE